MTEHAVVIVGGGPTGMMLAGELALAGVDVAIVERRASPELIGSRAGGLHSRTIEVLDQRGIAERFLSQGKTYPVAPFHPISLDISDFPTRHNYVLGHRHTSLLPAPAFRRRTLRHAVGLAASPAARCILVVAKRVLSFFALSSAALLALSSA